MMYPTLDSLAQANPTAQECEQAETRIRTCPVMERVYASDLTYDQSVWYYQAMLNTYLALIISERA